MTAVQKADPGARRKAIILVSVLSALGGILIVLFESNQQVISELLEMNLATNSRVLNAVLLMMLAPQFFVTYYLFAFGRRIVRTQRFPPPGQSVVRDTKIILSNEAVRRGRVLQCLAVASAVICMMFVVWWLLHEFGGQA